MSVPRKFLIVDDNADSRFLLVKTLLRKFPLATLVETMDGESASVMAQSENFDALIVHRAAEIDGIPLIRILRAANPTIPIVMVSGIDRDKPARDAGATAFLHYDAWLRIGTVVAEILVAQGEPSSSTAKASASAPSEH